MSAVHDITASIDIRAKVRRRKRFKRLLVLFVLIALSVSLVWLIFFSSVLATKQVSVTGNQIASAQQVEQAAEVPMGLPLARQKTADIAGRVSELQPVDNAKVSRGWPNTLRIEVHERQACFQLVKGQTWVWVDNSGISFNTVSEPTDGLLVASSASSESSFLADIATVAASLPTDFAAQVQLIQANTPNQIILELSDGRKVNWGSAEQSADKAAVIGALLNQPGTHYDVSVPSRPAIS